MFSSLVLLVLTVFDLKNIITYGVGQKITEKLYRVISGNRKRVKNIHHKSRFHILSKRTS